MSIATASRVRNEMCTMRICVDSRNEGQLSGRLFNAYYREPFHFDNWIQLIKQIEALFSKFGYPHETMTRRTFVDPEEQSEDSVPAGGSYGRRREQLPTPVKLYPHSSFGKLATFDTKVMFRQNATWQGIVRWVEEEASENFGSALELMYMVENSFDA